MPRGDSLSQHLTWQNCASGLGTAETLSLGGSCLGRLGAPEPPSPPLGWLAGLTGTPQCPPWYPPHSRSSISGWAPRVISALFWAKRCSKCRFLSSSHQSSASLNPRCRDEQTKPRWLRWSRICLQCTRHGFDPWVGKIPQRREWQPAPVFLLDFFPWTEEPGGLQSMGLQSQTQLSD